MKSKFVILLSVLFLVSILSGCSGTKETGAQTETEQGYSAGYEQGYAEGESSGYQKGYEAARKETGTAAPAEEAEQAEKTVYSSDCVNLYLEDFLQDSTGYHARFRAENKTDQELMISLEATAFNGVTLDLYGNAEVLAKDFSYILESCSKEDLAAKGIAGAPEKMKIAVAVYDREYNSLENGVGEADIVEGSTAYAEFPEKEVLYQEGGIRIISMGISEEEFGEKGVKFCIDNQTEERVSVGIATASAPGENLQMGLYADCLPGTRAIETSYIYCAEGGAEEDPEDLPFANVVFRISKNGGEESVLTEPLKVSLGKEGRFELSEDGKKLTVCMAYYAYEDSEWTATVSEEEVLVNESMEVAEVPEEESMEQVKLVYRAGRPGVSSLKIQFHPEGEDLQETEDHWPTIFVQKELNFRVTEAGTIEPGDVYMEADEFTANGDTVTWYYILDNTGEVLSKDTAAG